MVIISTIFQKQVQASRAVSRLGNQSNSHYRVNSSKIAGLHHPTSDGFLFNGQGIKGTTPTGILVEHHNHLHFISFADLRKGGGDQLLTVTNHKRKLILKNSHHQVKSQEMKILYLRTSKIS